MIYMFGQRTPFIRSVKHCGDEENCQQSRFVHGTILHQNSNIVCGIVGNTKSVNNIAYKSLIAKSISVNKPSSVSAVQTRIKNLNK